MGHPDVGMHYKDVKEKLTKFESVKTNPNLKDSLLNQVRLHDGEKAVTEMIKETESPTGQSCSTNFINASSMTILGGIGATKVRHCSKCGHKPARSTVKDGITYCAIHNIEVEEYDG